MTTYDLGPGPEDRVNELEQAAGVAADRLESVIQMLTMPLPDRIHVEGLRGSLPDIVRGLRAVVPRERP